MPGGFLQANRKNADTPRKGALSFSQRGQELHATDSSAEGILGDTLCLISNPPWPAIQMKTPRTGRGVLSLVAGAGYILHLPRTSPISLSAVNWYSEVFVQSEPHTFKWEV